MTQSLVDRFAAEHFTLNSISPRRQGQVLAAIDRYVEFLDGELLESASDEDLSRWLLSQVNEGLAPSTVNLYLSMVRTFYTWCWQKRIIEMDALMRIRGVKPPRGYNGHKPRPYSRKELIRMWAELEAKFPLTTERRLLRLANGTSRIQGPLRRHAMRLQLDAIIELALVCGLRRVEIYRLSFDDCHWDNKYLVVHGKRRDQNPKVREVPYPDSTRTAMRAWFRMRALMSPAPGLPVWLSVTGPDPAAGLSEDRMARILHSFGDWELHRLRHTAATERLRAGMTLEELQRFLGHSNIQMTLRYAELIRDDIHKSSERIDADFQRAIKPAA